MDVDIGGRGLKVIDIRGTYLTDIVGMTRDEVGKLRIETESGRRGSRYPWDLVDRVGEPW
jgi:hypothetical protein